MFGLTFAGYTYWQLHFWGIMSHRNCKGVGTERHRLESIIIRVLQKVGCTLGCLTFNA